VVDGSSSKVTAAHLKREAFLYVRQSTLRQVLENTESTQRQYALRQRAIALGWPTERVHIIDCDLGQSGASAADRAGFQQLVTEVSLGHAGIVLGLEVSRLARNSADWQRLLELCALADTLILDEDGLYNCNDFNDRLLLGLKGTMSEAELHFLRARLRGGVLNKARRGELASPLPVGFVYDDQTRVRLDPDQQVQQAVRLLFMTFRRTGAAWATVKYFRAEGILFPRRQHSGPHKGELVWGPLGHSRTLQLLHNPRYAGAFVYGRHQTRPRPDGSRQVRQQAREDWLVLMPNAHVGYIPWDEYEDNQRRLLAAAQACGQDRRKSPAREGPALLQGLVICGVCGRRMTVHYRARNSEQYPEYVCQREMVEHAERACQRIPGQSIDGAVVQLLFGTLTPLSLEVALAVQQEIAARHEDADQLRAKQVERAQYEADLARQRYLRVDPNNRLVADELEADWNATLRTLAQAQTEREHQRQQDQLRVDDQVRAQVMALTTDFPQVWHAPTTTDRDRKRMLRLLIEDVTLVKNPRQLTVQVRFRGGLAKPLTLAAPQQSWQTWQTAPEIVAEIDRLLNDHTDQEVATILAERGLHAGKGTPFRARLIGNIRREYGLASRYDRLRATGLLTADELAAKLEVNRVTVNHWRQAGLLHGHAYSDKPEYLYDPPTADAPTKQRGRKLANRRRIPEVVSECSKEVQYAA
jgi:DNA invertase Pin-like site-specific DNA recombinase